MYHVHVVNIIGAVPAYLASTLVLLVGDASFFALLLCVEELDVLAMFTTDPKRSRTININPFLVEDLL